MRAALIRWPVSRRHRSAAMNKRASTVFPPPKQRRKRSQKPREKADKVHRQSRCRTGHLAGTSPLRGDPSGRKRNWPKTRFNRCGQKPLGAEQGRLKAEADAIKKPRRMPNARTIAEARKNK